jgi:hypothetical protein
MGALFPGVNNWTVKLSSANVKNKWFYAFTHTKAFMSSGQLD